MQDLKGSALWISDVKSYSEKMINISSSPAAPVFEARYNNAALKNWARSKCNNAIFLVIKFCDTDLIKFVFYDRKKIFFLSNFRWWYSKFFEDLCVFFFCTLLVFHLVIKNNYPILQTVISLVLQTGCFIFFKGFIAHRCDWIWKILGSLFKRRVKNSSE